MMHRMATARNVRAAIIRLLAVAALALLVSAAQSQGKEITDIFGRQFSIADKPKKVYSSSPPMTNLLCAIDPTVLAGLNGPLRENQKKYMPKEAQSLPVLGGWFGQGRTPNIELVLRAKPEIIIIHDLNATPSASTNRTVLKTMPVPVMSIRMSSLSEYPEAILSLGRLLGREARTRELAAYTRQALSDLKAFVRTIPDKEKVSVYYAEGVKGLYTECDTSTRNEAIHLAGGRNVHHCEGPVMSYGMLKIDFEKVMVYNPDVIIVFEEAFYRNIFSDPLWQQIRAVKNKRVYLIPNQPFNWLDRPPSFMRFLGAQWLANVIYPNRYPIDIVQETQRFHKLFFGVDLSVDEARNVLRLPASTNRHGT